VETVEADGAQESVEFGQRITSISDFPSGAEGCASDSSVQKAGPYTGGVSETGDKRRRNDLDLFVLALLKDGLTTPYELQQGAGLSPGATIPALRRLVDAGYAITEKPGPYGRTCHRPTSAGRKILKAGWRQLIEAGPTGDLDADLRVALLALFVGRNRAAASDFLRRSAARTLQSVRGREGAESPGTLPPLALAYERLRRQSAVAVLRAQSAAARTMSGKLPVFRKRDSPDRP
jgi:DNA-binding PadR family transcriptional regulator